MNRLLYLWCLAAPCTVSAAAPTLTPDDIGTSARIPSVDQTVTYTVRLHAPADRTLSGEFRVTLDAADCRAAEKIVHLELAAAEHQDVTLPWTPAADGWHRLTFRVLSADSTQPDSQLERDVPVTHRPLVFLWFGAPQHFQWCNVPTTVKPEDRDWWLWRGALPCAWKGGVCDPEWSVGQYYVNPVLTLAPGSLQSRVKGDVLELSATLRNHGGMTARDVVVQFGRGWGPDFQTLAQQSVAALAPDGEAVMRAAVPLQAGVHAYVLRLVPPPAVAVLNDQLWTMTARGLPPEACVVCQPPTETPGDGLPLFAEAPAGLAITAARALAPDGQAAAVVAATLLPGLPGDPTGVVTWTPSSLPTGQPVAFQLDSSPAQDSPGLKTARSGDLLTVSGFGYNAVLDLAQDQIRSLKVQAAGPELLGSPWSFSSTGWSGTQPAQVQELPGGLLVTIPFDSPQAEGFSRYYCYAAAPVIRIERYFRPRAELTVTASSEGCRMPQRGGVYALQPGVGGLVRRGVLRDSSEYSDLLFGYLGSGPSPDNARLAGWFDCAFTQDGGGGLGVVIQRRWEAAHSDVGYDVTRYYDGGDWLSVLNLWGQKLVVSTPQTQIVYLLPHEPLALDQPAVVGPAQRLWNHLHP